MIRIHKIYAIVFAAFITVFFNVTCLDIEKNELEVACERAITEDNIEGLHELYNDALKGLPTDDQYEMERQRGNLLAYATFFGHEQVVRDLLARNFGPNKRSYYGSCALLYAIGRGHVNIVQLLLEAGADVESCNGYGESAVSIAQSFPVKVMKEQMLDILSMYGAVIVEKD